ncbi:MAG: hypothetical protein GX352_10275 [Clostridiales bacterium]|nr:hypothetical protein [Clostridiales bacterium]
MRRSDRQVFGRENICGLLDLFDTIHLGISDGEYPYVVPLNFGYEFDDDLVIYFHCGLHGKKLRLIEKNPKVCVTASKFANYVDNPFMGQGHDYRSVIAFGTASPVTEPAEKGRAIKSILRQYGHKRPCSGKDMPMVLIYKIVCSKENVTAKSEFPIRSKEDIPLVHPDDVAEHPKASETLGISDMVERLEHNTNEDDPYIQRLKQSKHLNH